MSKYITADSFDLLANISNLRSRVDRLERFSKQTTLAPVFPVRASTGYIATVASTGSVTTDDTQQDITGLTLNVPVAGTGDQFTVVMFYDYQSLTTAGGNSWGELVVDGVVQTGQIILITTSTGRWTVGQQWLVSGIASGVKTFKGVVTGPSGVYRVNVTHSTMRVERKGGSEYSTTVSVISGTFADTHIFPGIFLASTPIVHLLATCSDGTTAGEFRLTDSAGVVLTDIDGVAVPPKAIPAGTTTETEFINNQSPNYWGGFAIGSDQIIKLQVRRTAGAGIISIRAKYLIQVPS